MEDRPRSLTWIVTQSGKKFNPLEPDLDLIDIEDIAHALAHTPRFTGHTKEFYSVAQHSVKVSILCESHQLHGLLHDASEAYMCDIATPLKRTPEFAPYREAEARLQMAIYRKFRLKEDHPQEVKDVDWFVGVYEGWMLMPHVPGAFWIEDSRLLEDIKDRLYIECWRPDAAKVNFLNRFRELKSAGLR